MSKSIVYCSKCDNSEFIDAQCPNDIIQQTNYQQNEEGLWICPDCQ